MSDAQLNDAQHVITYGQQIEHLHPGISLFDAASHGPEELKAYLRNKVQPIDRVAFVVGPGFVTDSMHGQAIKVIRSMLVEKALAQTMSQKTLHRTSRLVGSNILHNLGQAARLGTSFASNNQFHGTPPPAFIVGAGPSLDANIAEIKEAQRRGIIIAVDVAGPALSRAGISPDFWISLESSPMREHLVASNLEGTRALVLDMSCSPDLVDEAMSTNIPVMFTTTLDNAVHWASRMFGALPIANGGSVSTLAMSLAIMWRCNPIVLVGQDHAFGPEHDLHYYASGSLYGDTTIKLGDNRVAEFVGAKKHHPAQLIPVQAWGGQGIVMTMGDYLAYNRWFARAAHAYSRTALGPATQWIDCTEGGARKGPPWREERLAGLVRGLPANSCWNISEPTPSSQDTLRYLVEREYSIIISHGRQMLELSTRVMAGQAAGDPAAAHDEIKLRELSFDLPVFSCFCAPAFAKLKLTHGMPFRERRRAYCQASHAATEDMLEVAIAAATRYCPRHLSPPTL